LKVLWLKLLFIIITSLASVAAWAHGMSVEDQARILNAGYLEYIRLGATHMLSGYDHLLFLFGVMFFLTRFSEIIKFITAFTIGHSITLVFATLFGITANYYLIDAVMRQKRSTCSYRVTGKSTMRISQGNSTVWSNGIHGMAVAHHQILDYRCRRGGGL